VAKRSGRQQAPPRARATQQAAAQQNQAGRPIGKWILYALGGAFVVLLIVVVSRTPDEVPDGAPDGVETVAVGERTHLDGEIPYEDAVPAGGPHNPAWLNCGVYDAPVPPEHAVHSLEHGAVWITYNGSITGDGISTLEDIGRRREKVIVSPVPEQEEPVLATSWGRRLVTDDPLDERIEQYAREFTRSRYAPEPGASCVGGVGNPVG
jgi:hypothetical protein